MAEMETGYREKLVNLSRGSKGVAQSDLETAEALTTEELIAVALWTSKGANQIILKTAETLCCDELEGAHLIRFITAAQTTFKKAERLTTTRLRTSALWTSKGVHKKDLKTGETLAHDELRGVHITYVYNLATNHQ